MAIQAFDGFDHYNNYQDMQLRSGFLQYTAQNSGAGWSFVNGRVQGKALQLGGTGSGLLTSFKTQLSTFYIGHAIQLTVTGTVGAQALASYYLMDLSLGAQGTPSALIQVNPVNASIQVYRNTATGTSYGLNSAVWQLVWSSGNNIFPVASWFFLEIGGTLSNATIRVNSQAIASGLNIAGTIATTNVGGFYLINNYAGSVFGGLSVLIDDLYVCDNTTTSGNYPANTFLGDMRCVTLFPIGNDSVQFTQGQIPSTITTLIYNNGGSISLPATLVASGTSQIYAIASFARKSGKVYLEWDLSLTGKSTTSATYLGFGAASSNPGFIQDLTNSVIVRQNGDILVRNTVQTGKGVGLIYTYARIAIDFDNKLIWAANATGNWNNSATADPVAGVGGISFSTFDLSFSQVIPYLALYGTGQFTVNFGQLAFNSAVPTGFDAGWFPQSAPNWQQVDETAMDSDQSFNASYTVGAQDTFNFQTTGALLNSIYAVAVTGAYRKDDVGTRSLKQVLKSGAATVNGPVYGLSTSYNYVSDVYALDPNTNGNWTKTAVDAIKAGYVINA